MDPVKPPRFRKVFISFRDTNNDAWLLSFTPTCGSLVMVTRTGDTWDFVPPPGGIACLEREKKGNKGSPILQGRYIVPFKFTVTLLP